MAVQLIIAVTDRGWFDFLRERPELDEVNFWSPGAAPFKALQAGELFLFKLHAPYNVIVGGGIFTYANTMPCSLAWQAFGPANGTASLRRCVTASSSIESAKRKSAGISLSAAEF